MGDTKARSTTASPASKAITSRTRPSGAAGPPRRASAAMPRTPARCTAAITRHAARTATLADQCETTMFMTVVGRRPADADVSLSGQAYPFRSKQVKQHPEKDSHHREVVPDEGEGTQRRLEALHREGFGVGGWLLHEEDPGEWPRAHQQDLQPDHRAEDADHEHRVETGEHTGETRASRLEREVQQFDDLQHHGSQAK